MFPTTVWTTIRQAGQSQNDALERFATRYRPVIVDFVRSRGFSNSDADDVCQEVFVKILAGDVLAGADPSKGRFRSLVLTITTHVIIDRHRRDKKRATLPLPHDAPQQDPAFDRAWVLHLVELALTELQQQGSPYYGVLRDHLAGHKQDRNRLWIARKKLIAEMRREIAATCQSHHEFESEVEYLSEFLTPVEKSPKKTET